MRVQMTRSRVPAYAAWITFLVCGLIFLVVVLVCLGILGTQMQHYNAQGHGSSQPHHDGAMMAKQMWRPGFHHMHMWRHHLFGAAHRPQAGDFWAGLASHREFEKSQFPATGAPKQLVVDMAHGKILIV